MPDLSGNISPPHNVIPAPLAREARERDQAGTQVTGLQGCGELRGSSAPQRGA
jgi:hypothetical protein